MRNALHPATAFQQLARRYLAEVGVPAGQRWAVAGRWLVLLMQLKDSVAIGLLLANGLLFFGILLGFGVPGLVFYKLRWRQIGQAVPLRRVAWLAGLSLAHEVLWAWVFFSDMTSPHYGGPDNPDTPLPHYANLYLAGALLCAGQLLVLVPQAKWWQRATGATKALLHSVLWFGGAVFARYALLLMLRVQAYDATDSVVGGHWLLWSQLLLMAASQALVWYQALWKPGRSALAAPLAEPPEAGWHWLLRAWLALLLLFQGYALYKLAWLVDYALTR